MKKKILLIGGGGHCKSVLDSLLDLNEYAEIGIVDNANTVGGQILGVPVVGADEDLPELFRQGYQYAFVAIGSIGNPVQRIKLNGLLEEIGFISPQIIDPSAIVSPYAVLETGVFVGKRAVINAGATIGKCAIINTGAIVEHDCRIGDYVHISPGAVLSGGVSVSRHSHIGSNATVRQQISIGSDVIIGVGSVVVKDIPAHTTAYGNPCKGVDNR